MIPLDATLHATQLPVSAIVLTADEHWPAHLDLPQIQHYAQLLQDNPQQDTDPIVVVPHGSCYTPTNGRHRFVAHLVAGRETIAAVIVQSLGEKHE